MSTDNTAMPRRSEADLLDQLVNLSGANRMDNVVIAGQGQIELLLGLLRRGFARVTCRAADHGPSFSEPYADLIIVPNVCSEASLLAAVTRLGAEVRPGGTLVLQAECPAGPAKRIRRLLGDFGFDAIEQQQDSKGTGLVLAARKRSPAHQAHAA